MFCVFFEYEGLRVEGFLESIGVSSWGGFLWVVLSISVYISVPYAFFNKIYYLSKKKINK
jgi:hypothetical protein